MVPTLWFMAVHLTRIYTRTGDAGLTALGDGTRVAKTDPRVEAYAGVDETNAAIGVALALGDLPREAAGILMIVQNDLFDVGADLCVPIASDATALRVNQTYIERLEAWCDQFNAGLPALDSFILPGGSPTAALLHLARAVCRRAERGAWRLYELDPHRTNVAPAVYLNRLSDLLFVLARAASPGGGRKWTPGGVAAPRPEEGP